LFNESSATLSKMYTVLAGASIAIVATALIWRYIVYPLFLSPLASIPAAHPLARFTSLWIEWQRLHGNDFQSISRAFATKGPYVQLAPRELAINDIEAVNCVWGIGAADFDKHPSYEYWATQGCVYLILCRGLFQISQSWRLLHVLTCSTVTHY